MYQIKIKADSIPTLQWLNGHGYDARFYDLATVVTEPDETGDDCFIFQMEEHKAWEFRDNIEQDQHAFLACCGDTDLRQALTDFEMSII